MLITLPAQADMVVIMKSDCGVEQLSRQDVINIYMGRYRSLSNGSSAVPMDIDGSSPEKEYFYNHLLDKTLPEINAYWARLIFSGKIAPPEIVPTQSEALKRISRDCKAIAYVDRLNLNDRVKVVYEFKP
jgi:hypothetical protein